MAPHNAILRALYGSATRLVLRESDSDAAIDQQPGPVRLGRLGRWDVGNGSQLGTGQGAQCSKVSACVRRRAELFPQMPPGGKGRTVLGFDGECSVTIWMGREEQPAVISAGRVYCMTEDLKRVDIPGHLHAQLGFQLPILEHPSMPRVLGTFFVRWGREG